jgi:hypothetical protein
MRFRQAKQYRKGRRGKKIRVLVLHCTATKELSSTAWGVAGYFSTVTRKASAHVVFDNVEGVECVHEGDTACGAGGVNNDGYHIEQVGVLQTRTEWLDDYGKAMIELVVHHVAYLCKKYDIPAQWLTVAQIRDGHTKGLTWHKLVDRAFGDISPHGDPGDDYPYDYFMDRLKAVLGNGEDEMTPEDRTFVEDAIRAQGMLTAKAVMDHVDGKIASLFSNIQEDSRTVRTGALKKIEGWVDSLLTRTDSAADKVALKVDALAEKVDALAAKIK